jgi:hypothetical protein
VSHGIASAIGLALVALIVSDATSQPSAPPAVPLRLTDDFTVVSRIDNTQTVEAVDQKLLLTKARREEHAVVRRLLFISATLRLTEPLDSGDPAPSSQPASSQTPAASGAEPEAPPAKQTCRWTYRAFLQRQICFISMSGLSSCTQPEIVSLPEEASGDAPLTKAPQQDACNDIFRPAVTARIRLTTALLSRSKDLYAADQQTKIDPMFKAAGVSTAPELPPNPQNTVTVMAAKKKPG